MTDKIKFNKKEREAIEWLAEFSQKLLDGEPAGWTDVPVKDLRKMGIDINFILHSKIKTLVRNKSISFDKTITNADWYLRGKLSKHYLPFQIKELKEQKEKKDDKADRGNN
jgi:hypothetical protein